MTKKKNIDCIKYTREEQLRAVAMIEQLGSASKASRALGIGRTKLIYWQKTLGEEIKKDTQLQVAQATVSREIKEAITDARHRFLSEHYSELNKVFRLAIQKTIEGLNDGELNATQTMYIAEKISNIINSMSTAEATNNTQINNLLQFCINEVEKTQ